MVVTLELRATQNGVIWPRRPLVSSKGLLSCLQNVPHSSHDRKATCFRDVSFNASGDVFAATDEKGRVFVFFVSANRYALVQHLGAPTVACCFSPTRKSELLVTCENEMIRCIDVHANSLISSLRGHRSPARSASFQKSGDLALTASRDAVILWDTKDWSRYRVLNAGPGVEEATFVAKGDLVAVCFQDDSIMMWELDSLALRYRFALPEQEKPGGLSKIAVSADCKILVATGRSRFIYVWDFESQTIIRIIELPPPIEEVNTFAFAPGYESTICLLDNEGSLFFLDVTAKRPKITLEISSQGKKFTGFDIENHGRYLVACTEDGCLLLYDLDIAKETAQRSHAHRKEQGLEELEDNLRLRTRSVLRYGRVDSQAPDDEEEAERPASSKLIDGIFGSKVKRVKESSTANEAEATDDQTGNSHGIFSPRVLLNRPSGVTTSASQTTYVDKRVVTRRQKSPLQMATLSEEEIELNRTRLENSLRCNGKYPSKYRLLVWTFLLRLPKNDVAFKALAAKGSHPAYITLHEEYPLKNRRHFRRLHRVLSAIAFWCPAFGEVSYLPSIVYPFVKMYRENDVAAFEASVCILLHWCRDFLVNLPHPPLLVLTSIHAQLEKVDPQLYDHFVKHNVTPEIYGWSLLSSIFTEVLSGDEWMCLWDHLLTASTKPWLLQVAVLAYVVYFRTALLAAKERYSIEQFFHQQNPLQVHSFLRLLTSLAGKLGDFRRKELTHPAAVRDIHDPVPTSYWPLPKGQYPAFANYPKFVVDYQISERNRIAIEEAELLQKKELLKRIEVECGKLKEAHERWLQDRRTLVAAEEKRHKDLLAAEKSRILNLRTVDRETRKRRLERLAELEQATKESLEETSKLFEAEYLRLQTEVDIVKERSEYEIVSRQQEEELQRMEFETEKRVAEIHKKREVEERLQQLRTEFVTRIKQDELQDLMAFEQWKRDDEAQRLAAKLEIEKREKLARLEQERTVRQQLENRLLDHVLEKEQQLLELHTQRRARVQEEKADRHLTQRVDELEHQLQSEAGRNQSTPRATTGKKAVTVRMPEVQSPEQASRPSSGSGGRSRGAPSVSSKGTTRSILATRQRPSETSVKTRPDQQHDEDGYDADGTAHVTRESIRLLDTARRRLSSVLHQSNESQSSHSSSRASSFDSTPVTRTNEEQTLLEKALADVSGSSSSSSVVGDNGYAPFIGTADGSLFQGISPVRGIHQNPQISMPDATALLQDDSVATLVNNGIDAIRHGSSLSDLSSGDASSSMLQRPLEDLEQELGIRFADYSDEEKEEEYDEDEDDSELEEDRELLLQRAKKLLAESSFLAAEGSDDE